LILDGGSYCNTHAIHPDHPSAAQFPVFQFESVETPEVQREYFRDKGTTSWHKKYAQVRVDTSQLIHTSQLAEMALKHLAHQSPRFHLTDVICYCSIFYSWLPHTSL
jgi:hypothetical protein